MHSRKSSLGPNNPASWMDNLNSNLSQQLKPEQKSLRRDAHGISTLRNIAASVNRTQKQSPSTALTSGSTIKGI